MQPRSAVYLDSNAGAPLLPSVGQKLSAFFQDPLFSTGNPSSTHQFGQNAAKLWRDSLQSCAVSLGTTPGHLIAVSSGTEAIQTALRSVFENPPSAPPKNPAARWITTEVEHEAVFQMREWLRSRGVETEILRVDTHGIIDLDQFKSIVQSSGYDRQLLTLNWVGNETGVIQPIGLITQILQGTDILLQLDGAQAWGKLPIKLDDLGVDFATFVAHKIGALPGCGLLYVRDLKKFRPIFLGHQQKGLRGGTENLMGMLAMGEAACKIDPARFARHTHHLTAPFESFILDSIPGARIVGSGADRIPNTSSICIPGLPAASLIPALDVEGYAISAGSACSSHLPTPSRVLLAMGLSTADALCTVRVSVHEQIDADQMNAFSNVFLKVVRRLRSHP